MNRTAHGSLGEIHRSPVSERGKNIVAIPPVSDVRALQDATTAEGIPRGLHSGPGPLACDSMLEALPTAKVAIPNMGGIRRDLAAGDTTAANVLEVMPFANTLVLVDLTGAELKTALEEGIDFLMTRYPGYETPPVPYVGGVRFSLSPAKPCGSRVSKLELREGKAWQTVRNDRSCRIVANGFVAGGGDGFKTIQKASGFRMDTGMIDSEAFGKYIEVMGTVANPAEERVAVVP